MGFLDTLNSKLSFLKSEGVLPENIVIYISELYLAELGDFVEYEENEPLFFKHENDKIMMTKNDIIFESVNSDTFITHFIHDVDDNTHAQFFVSIE